MRISHPKTGETLVFAHPRPTPGLPSAVTLRLTAIEDRNDRRIDITWSGDDTPALITHQGGYRVAIDHHPTLRRITAYRLLDTDAPGAETVLLRFAYSDAGDLTEIYNSSGLPLRLSYDEHHRVTGWTDRNGTEFAYTYDDAGRVISTSSTDDFLSSTFRYDNETRTTTLTNSLGSTTTFEHNDAYRLVRTTDPLDNATVQEWSEDNRHVIAVTDPLGRTSRYAHDGAGNITAVVRPDGSGSEAAYNDFNQPTRVTEPGGAVWLLGYDERGNLATTADPTGGETRYGYDASGFLVGWTDAVGNTIRIANNPAGLPVSYTDSLGNTTAAERDAFGRVVSTVDPLGGTTRMGWTIEGNPAWYEAADGGRQEWVWDGEENLLQHTGPTGAITRHAYTHFGLMTSRTDPDGSVHSFSYDTERRLTRVTNPLGHTWSYTYDEAGRLTAERDFAGRAQTYTLDAADQLIARTNGAGQTIRYAHDLLGRVAEQDTESAVSRFAYDPAGRLTTAIGGDATLRLSYDSTGCLLTETCDGRTITYAYDGSGRPILRRTPSGAETAWAYDAVGRPVSMRAVDRTISFRYDRKGREIHRDLGPVGLSHTWDEFDRLTSQTVTRSASVPQGEPPAPSLLRRTHAFREDGHPVEVSDSARGRRTMELDATGRVTGVTGANWRETYAYDAAGDLRHADAPTGTGGSDADVSGDRDLSGALLRRAGQTTYDYDGQGRVIRQLRRLLSGGSRIWSYVWDAQDRLTSITTPDGTTWRYLYDPLGRRVAKQRLGDDRATVVEQITFTWDGGILAEQSHTGTESDRARVTTWHWGPDAPCPLAQTERGIDADRAAQDEIDERFYAIVTDLVGAPSELIDDQGDIVWRSRTTLWGNRLDEPSDGPDCPLGYPGQYHDTESGLDYNLFRYYEPRTARYLSPDPLGLEPAPNPYTYVSNPLSPRTRSASHRACNGWRTSPPRSPAC